MSNIRFVNKGKVGDIWLYNEVGDGWFGGMSAKTFGQELRALGKVDRINLHINSPGGSVFDGVAIHNMLASHPAAINVSIDSLAASIASVIAMAGDEINIADNAMLMIHDPHTMAAGGAAEMRKTADLLEQIGGTIADTYAKRTGQPLATVRKMMADETWLDATQARELGFATAITEALPIAASLGSYPEVFHRVPKLLKVGADAGHSIARARIALMEKRLPT